MTCTIYILTPRTVIWRRQGLMAISIHALQTECDTIYTSNKRPIMHFYPRTPNGVRLPNGPILFTIIIFLSTHSKRSETVFPLAAVYVVLFLSTHSKRSATSQPISIDNGSLYFYPRTPNGVRPLNCFFIPFLAIFLSTHSKRSATHNLLQVSLPLPISIHALQTECDYSPHSQ